MQARFNFLALLIHLCYLLTAQMPDTDIWLFKMERDKEQGLILKEGRNITARKGYDNQPAFSADGKQIYFSSVRNDSQADIYTYELKTGKIKAFTMSPESEYSPTLHGDGRLLSTVVVEKDSAQRIHFLDAITAIPAGKLTIDSVGYCAFVNQDTLVYFKLTTPQSLRYYVRSSGENRLICTSPIRSILACNRHSFIYGQKDSSSTTFYRYDFFLKKAAKLCCVPSLSEDVLWDEELGLLRSEKSQILRYEVKSGKWLVLYDFASFGIETIARFRLDLRHKQMVVVQVHPGP